VGYTAMNYRDMTDSWLRAATAYQAWVQEFTQQFANGQGRVAAGMLVDKARQIPGLQEQWQQMDPKAAAQGNEIVTGRKVGGV